MLTRILATLPVNLIHLKSVAHSSKSSKTLCFIGYYEYGGEGGIRTHGTVSRTLAFEASAFNRSATSPRSLQTYRSRALHFSAIGRSPNVTRKSERAPSASLMINRAWVCADGIHDSRDACGLAAFGEEGLEDRGAVGG